MRFEPEDFADSREGKFAIIFVVAILIGYLAYSNGLIRASIAPGFQGISPGVAAYQVGQNQATTLGGTLPTRQPSCGYSWNNYAASGFSITSLSQGGVFNPGGFFNQCNGGPTNVLFTQVQGNAVPYSPPFSQTISGSYTVQVPGSSTQTEVVNFKVNQYQFSINTGINAGGGGYNFGGDTIWGVITDNTWDMVNGPGGASACNPATASATSQCVFEAPLFAQVSNFQTQNWANNNCVQCTNGAALSFYTSTSAGGASNTLGGGAVPTIQGVQNALGNAYAPDSRMVKTVYFPISLQQFAGSCGFIVSQITGCGGIQANFQITLYTLQIGEYIQNSQNPSKQGLGTNPTQSCAGIQCNLNGIGACFSFTNFLCWGTLSTLGAFGLVVVILIFAGPTVVALLALYTRQKGSEDG